MVSAIVLAAGLSSRMQGDNKLVLPYKNSTIVNAVINELLLSGIKDLIIVTGHEEDKIRTLLAGYPVRFIHNTDYQKGMTTSIQKGISISEGNGYMICLADMIKIKAAEYTYLIESFEKLYALNQKIICQPAYNNEKGNPVIFSSYYKDAILSHSEMDGCKIIVKQNIQHLHLIAMEHNHILSDVDFPEDYEKLMN